MEPTFFPDGYTREAYIKASPGFHGAVAFTYRPMVLEERRAALSKLTESSKESPQATVARLTKFLLGKVLSWDIVHPETGDAIPVDAAMLPRVAPEILIKMELIVLGIEKSDDKPDGPSGAEESEADAKN